MDEFIAKGLKEIAQVYDLADCHLFPMWVISGLHYNGDRSEQVLEEIYQGTYELLEEGPPGDEKLDGFFFEEDSCSAYLYQAKWPESAGKKCGKSEAEEVGIALRRLLEQAESIEQIPKNCDARRKVVQDIKKVLQHKGKIVLRAVTGGVWATDYTDDVRALVDSSLKDHVEIEFYDAARLHRDIEGREADLKSVRCEIDLFSGAGTPHLTFPSAGVKGIGDSYVTLLSGFSLADLAVQHKDKLFARNVRYFLGRAGKKANKNMRETLEDSSERKEFWYGHNGITVLCDECKIDGASGETPMLSLTNPQIVNGCQTTITIKECFGDEAMRQGQEDFPVLGRVIKLSGSEDERSDAAEMIADRTNTQSAVNNADLRANDPVQRRLQERMKNYGDGWFYERKRGAWKTLSNAERRKFRSRGKADRKFDRELYQQAWRSYIGTPSSALTKKGEVWEANSDLYQRIFDDDRRECDVVFVCTLFDWFTQAFTVKDSNSLCVDIQYGLSNHLSEMQRAKTLVVAHSVGLVGYLVKSAYDSFDSYPQREIEDVAARLDRGTFVRKNWSKAEGCESWRPLMGAISKVMETWKLFLRDVAKEEEMTLYAALKRPNEETFEVLCQTIKNILDDPPKVTVTPIL